MGLYDTLVDATKAATSGETQTGMKFKILFCNYGEIIITKHLKVACFFRIKLR